MLETASRIHSANGGVRASQARDDDPVAFTDAVCVSGAIFIGPPLDELKGAVWRREMEILMVGICPYEPRGVW